MKKFENKVALVIGGTSGIGNATAQTLLKEGAQVHVVGRNTNKIPDAENLTKHIVDISDVAQVEKLIAEVKNFQNIDYLVNASGIFGPKTFLRTYT